MTIFAITKTFPSNTLDFTDGKSSLPQGQSYVLQLKCVCLLFGNSCSSITSVSYHLSISSCC